MSRPVQVVPSAYFVAKDTIWNEEVIISMRSVIASFAFQAFSIGCLGVRAPSGRGLREPE